MVRHRAFVALLLASLSQASAYHADATESPEAKLMIEKANPLAIDLVETLRWRIDFERRFRPVRQSWTRLTRAIRKGELAQVPSLCLPMRLAVQELLGGEPDLPTDAAARLHLMRALERLSRAADLCSRERLFEFTYELAKARSSIQLLNRRIADLVALAEIAAENRPLDND